MFVINERLSLCGRCLGIVILLICVSCNAVRQKPFSFVQICDPQLGMGGYEHDLETFKQAVEQINELNCDFVVICGDLVHHASDSSFSDFLEITKVFNIPCYLVAGNHDVGNIPNDTTLSYYRDNLGKDYYMFENKGYSFIVTNTQLWKTHIGEESEVHDRWFKATLEKRSLDQEPVFVIGHHPLFVKHADEEEEYFNLPALKRQELLDLFVNNHVVAYLSGHKHETLLNTYQNIQLVSGESTSKNFDRRPLGFRQWEISDDTIMHHFVPLEAFGDYPFRDSKFGN